MTKKKVYPIHKSGERTGYEEFEDGSIKVAPCMSEQMDNLITRKTSLGNLIREFTKQCNELMIPIDEGMNVYWDRISVEYSLDRDKYQYTYRGNGVISRKEKIVDKEG